MWCEVHADLARFHSQDENVEKKNFIREKNKYIIEDKNNNNKKRDYVVRDKNIF